MTRIGFYILRSSSPDAFVCRLCQQLYGHGTPLYVYSDDADTVRRIDEALWTFQPGSFVPHDVVDDGVISDAPVALSTHAPDEARSGVLINLADQVPLFFSRFERVAEIVADDAMAKQHGRARYAFYRDRGYDLQTHNNVDG